MADLKQLVDAKDKSANTTVQFDYRKYRNIGSVDYSRGLSNAIGSATVTMWSKPEVNPETEVRIFAGYNGEEKQVFTGLIDSITRDNATGAYTIQCRDMLKKAMDTFLVQEVAFGIDVVAQKYYYSTYTGNNGGEFTIHEYDDLEELQTYHPETNGNITSEGVKAEAVVQWMLRMCGLNEGSQIQVRPTNFFIGDIKPVRFHLTSVFDAIGQIGELIGWYVTCDANGVSWFKKKPRRDSGFTSWNYSKGKENILQVSKDINNLNLRNYVEVHGASGITSIRREGSPYLGTTPYRGVLVANELIDTQGIANFMSARIMADLNRLTETINLQVEGNPYLDAGQSIRVSSDVANGTFLIEEISSSISAEAGYMTSITANTFPDDSSAEEDSDIKAMFTIGQTVSIGDPTILVFLDGSSSYSSTGNITKYDWKFTNSLTDDTAGASAYIWAAFPMENLEGGNSATVSLTVTDLLGNTDTISSGISLASLLDQGKMLYRQLYAALTDQARGTRDGGITWNKVDIPATAVGASVFDVAGEYTVSGYALFGTSAGALYQTTDFCASVTEIGSVGSRINHVHIPELDASRVLLSCEDGSLYQSLDFGLRLSKLYQFDSAVKQAEYGYTDPNYISVVTSGGSPGAWVSHDGGATWGQLADFGNVEMHWYTAGSMTPYWAHNQGITASTPGPTPIPFEAASGVQLVKDIRAATVAIDDDTQIWAVESNGQHWTFSGGSMKPMEYNPDNVTRHMIRDGDIPIIGYYATQKGVYKSIDRNTNILPLLDLSVSGIMPSSPVGTIPEYGWGEQVAYGPLAPILPKAFGNVVVHLSNHLDSYSFSGYLPTGVPVYVPKPGVIDGLHVAISGGWCWIDTGNLSGDGMRVSQGGPSYLVVLNDALEIPEDDGSSEEPPPIVVPSGLEDNGVVVKSIGVLDMTGLEAVSGIVASGQFIPIMRLVGWLPYEYITDDYDPEHPPRYNIMDVKLDPTLNLATRDKTRFYVHYIEEGALLRWSDHMEAFEATKSGILNSYSMLSGHSESDPLHTVFHKELFDESGMRGGVRQMSPVTRAHNYLYNRGRGGSSSVAYIEAPVEPVADAEIEQWNLNRPPGAEGAATDYVYSYPVKFPAGKKALISEYTPSKYNIHQNAQEYEYDAKVVGGNYTYKFAFPTLNDGLSRYYTYVRPNPFGKIWITDEEGKGKQEVPLTRSVLATNTRNPFGGSTTTDTFSSPIVNIYGSAMVSSDVYHADLTNVYRTSAYGLGDSEILYTAPSGYQVTYQWDTIEDDGDPFSEMKVPTQIKHGINHFSVTHNREFNMDYLTVTMTRNYTPVGYTGTQFLVAYSVDAGLTWSTKPARVGSFGSVQGAWWVDA